MLNLNKIKKNRFFFKLFFIIAGVTSTIWFLVRVIPKPSRATYPCMKAAAPMASSFIIYLLSLGTGTFFLKKALAALSNRKTLLSGLFVIAMLAGFGISIMTSNVSSDAKNLYTLNSKDFVANEPIGEAKGLFPGRVVWVHDKDATNENWTGSSSIHATDDSNVDQEVVNTMLENGIKNLTGSDTVSKAWNNLFVHFNSTHGHGSNGYQSDEKIAIKVNLTGRGWAKGDRVDQTPQLIYALLKQLTEEVGVAQRNITIGDPYRKFVRHNQVYLEKLMPAFPDVRYVAAETEDGVVQTFPSANDVIVFSDGKYTSSIPQYYVDADYFINMSILKSHNSAGITIAAKNHQGSILEKGDAPNEQSAMFMHYCFPDQNPGYKKYRHLVDYMGHEQLGGKTLFYLVDALWAGHNWKGIVRKWEMEPFNNDYPNSLLLAQDPVAIESVCYDFLLEEYSNKTEERYPYLDGADDYILQAADPSNWPAHIQYDPEGDGSVIGSLGVHEHWNNAIDKQYSRNLGKDEGIELIKVDGSQSNPTSIEQVSGDTSFELKMKIFPNPASEYLNIEMNNEIRGKGQVKIYDLTGRAIKTFTIEKQNQVYQKKLSVNYLENGVYNLRVELNGFEKTQAFIKR